MNLPILRAGGRRGPDGRVVVLAPGVGWWSGHPDPDAVLDAGDSIGILERLNRAFALRLPEDVSGSVSGALPRDRRVPVDYGLPLFELRSSEPDEEEDSAKTAATGTSSKAPAEEEGWPVLSPTDGVFYRRPAPDAAPFVLPGSRVRAGQTIGLVEVMKTFNPIVFAGPGLPQEAEVAEIRCEDAQEVRAGQVLMILR